MEFRVTSGIYLTIVVVFSWPRLFVCLFDFSDDWLVCPPPPLPLPPLPLPPLPLPPRLLLRLLGQMADPSIPLTITEWEVNLLIVGLL